MNATGKGILGFFTLAFIILVIGVAVDQSGTDPIAFYQFSTILVAVGVFLIIKRAGGLGSFGIKS